MRVEKARNKVKKEKSFKWDEKVNNLVEVKQRTKRKTKCGKLKMDSIVDSLPVITETKHTKPKSSRPVGKKQARIMEIAHFNKILQHPGFKTDPLKAISMHISNVHDKQKEL